MHRKLIIILGSLLLLLLFFLEVINAPYNEMNGRRMVASAALVRGFSAYYPQGTGPQMNGVNGPVQILAYAPAAFFSRPIPTILMGALTAMLFFFVPVGILFAKVPLSAPMGIRWLCFLCFCLFGQTIPSLRFSATMIHADSVALGVGLLSCFFLILSFQRKKTGWVMASAVTSVLALFTKISMLPLGPALLLYLWVFKDRKSSLLFLVTWGISFGLLTVLFGGVFGFEALYFSSADNALKSEWIRSFSVPRYDYAVTAFDKVKILLAALFRCMKMYLLPVVGVLGLVAASYGKVGGETKFPKAFWPLFVWVGVCLLPLGLVGRVRYGGYHNSFSVFGYYLLVGMTLGLLEVMASSTVKASIRTFASIACIVLIGYSSILLLVRAYGLSWPLKHRQAVVHEVAFNHLKAHPGTTYFPDQPLAHLMAEGKLYHSGASVMEFDHTEKLRLSEEHFKKFIPEQVEAIAYHYSGPHPLIQKYFPGWVGQADPELSRWTIYKRP